MKVPCFMMVAAIAALSGACRAVPPAPAEDAERERPCEDIDEYLDEMKAMLADPSVAGDMLAGSSFTTREYSTKHTMTYVDLGRSIFSYRSERYVYLGGAHGMTFVAVGTIDIKTGRELELADVLPEARRAEALAQVERAVLGKIGGRDSLLDEVTLTENFYIARDGLHFVFNQYEVAPYCYGVIDVAIPECAAQSGGGH